MNIRTIQKRAHELAVKKGWYDGPNRQVPELLCLIHSEISEALEAYRSGYMTVAYYGDGKPEGLPIELADAVIRIADMAEYLGINLEKYIAEKMRYNKSRPYRHGNKRA